jgi:hypothetical protein
MEIQCSDLPTMTDGKLRAIQNLLEEWLIAANISREIIDGCQMHVVTQEKGTSTTRPVAVRSQMPTGIGLVVKIRLPGKGNDSCFAGNFLFPHGTNLNEIEALLRGKEEQMFVTFRGGKKGMKTAFLSLEAGKMTIEEKARIFCERLKQKLHGGADFSTKDLTEEDAAVIEYGSRDILIACLINFVRLGVIEHRNGKGMYRLSQAVLNSDTPIPMTLEDFYLALNDQQQAALPLLRSPECQEAVTGRSEFRFPGTFPLEEEDRRSFVELAYQVGLFSKRGKNGNGVEGEVWCLNVSVYDEVIALHKHMTTVEPSADIPPSVLSGLSVPMKEVSERKPTEQELLHTLRQQKADLHTQWEQTRQEYFRLEDLFQDKKTHLDSIREQIARLQQEETRQALELLQIEEQRQTAKSFVDACSDKQIECERNIEAIIRPHQDVIRDLILEAATTLGVDPRLLLGKINESI